MKKLIALSFLLTSPLFADNSSVPVSKALPEIPSDCLDQISANGLYCSNTVLKGTFIDVTYVGVVSKALFPTVDSLMNQYLGFEHWPDYAAASPETVVEYKANGSGRLPALQDADGKNILRQTYDYTLKVTGVPLLKHRIKGVTYHYDVEPYKGAAKSSEFIAQTGVVEGFSGKTQGMKSQIGSVHAIPCDGRDFCSDDQWIFIFYTKVEPDISFAMNLVKDTIQSGLEDFLVGMFDESQAPEITE